MTPRPTCHAPAIAVRSDMRGSIASTARAATARLRNPLANNISQPANGLVIGAPRTAFAALSPYVRKCGPLLRRCNNPEHCKPLYTCSVCDRRRAADSLYASTFNRILQYGFDECSALRGGSFELNDSACSRAGCCCGTRSERPRRCLDARRRDVETA
jgi:hypothetical protein